MSESKEYKERVFHRGDFHDLRMMVRDIDLGTAIEVIMDNKERFIFLRYEDVPETEMVWAQDNEGETELSIALTPALNNVAGKYFESLESKDNEEIVDDLEF